MEHGGAAQDRLTEDDVIFRGDDGFWNYWWQLLQHRKQLGRGPLNIDFMLSDDGAFTRRNWIATLDAEVRTHVVKHGLVTGRAIVPPDVIGSAVEPFIDLGIESGFQIRVLSVDARFVLYDGEVAVVSESPDDGSDDLHRATRAKAFVTPLVRLFDQLWHTAVPWHQRADETSLVLALLADGLTDTQVARELGISARTVNRRVAEAMNERGAQSRFQLGTSYGSSRLQ